MRFGSDTAKQAGWLMDSFAFQGVPIIRIIVYWGLYWGPLNLGNYQIALKKIRLDRHAGRGSARGKIYRSLA